MSFDLNALTAKQKKVYSAIESFIKLKGIPPTVREIGELVGEKTPGAVQGILNRLEQKGVIKRETGMARSIQLVTNNSQYLTPAYIPEIKRINRRNADDLLSLYNVIKYHPVSPDLMGSCNECFLLAYKGSILPEDDNRNYSMLLICKDCSISDGDNILAVYENHTILRQYFACEDPDSIVLKTDNNLLEKEIFAKTEVTVIGKVAAEFIVY